MSDIGMDAESAVNDAVNSAATRRMAVCEVCAQGAAEYARSVDPAGGSIGGSAF